MTLLYPDVSNNNWSSDNDVVNFLSALPGQFAGVVHKVTQGNDFCDEYWPTAYNWCQIHDFPIIGMHYVDLSDPDEQAERYRSYEGTPNVMFDFETGSGDMGNFWVVCDAFNNAGVNVQLGYAPEWYVSDLDNGDLSALAPNGVLLVSSAYPAGPGSAFDIYAAAGGDDGEGWAPYNGATPSAWQFTDQASIAGFTVDCNAYRGADIHELFG